MSTAAPLLLQRSNERRLPADYRGDILLWDIDKTYLDTRFSSWRGLLAIPFEFAIDKRTIPGAVPLLRALRRGPGEESAIVPLYFVSGSPPQLRKVVERRMTLDGVDFDGITFKDQLGLLLAGRVQDIRAQVGYKLAALLLYRRELPVEAPWLLFGDDVEQDADTFLLFGEVCSGLRGEPLAARLAQEGASDLDVALLVQLAQSLPVTRDPVEKIFVHLERGTDPHLFADPRIVPTRSYVQATLVLQRMGRVRLDAIATVARDMRVRGVPESVIVQHLADAEVRLDIPEDLTRLARAAL
jgi:hypothetical protein